MNKYLMIFPLCLILIPLVVATDFMVVNGEGKSVYFLIVVFSWISSLILWKKIFDDKRKLVWLFILMLVVLYLMSLYGIFWFDTILEYKLYEFDLDGDSIFSQEEQTAEQEKYMRLYINDAGRNYFYLTGIFVSIIISLFMCIVTGLYMRMKKSRA